jgi:hypothetical protein
MIDLSCHVIKHLDSIDSHGVHLERLWEFLSSSEYKRHQQTHLQTHIDSWSNSKLDKVSWKPLDDMTQDLFKIFEKYGLGERAMLWVQDVGSECCQH